MRNKILSFTRDSIPYVKGLRTLPLVKSVAAAILMQQLDYWFARYPDGFYKFLQPCLNHPAYKEGDSWAEELAFSCGEFRTAFDSIGVRYMSKKAYNDAEHKFEMMSADSDIFVKYYCSYHDKQKGVTWYFRNHDFVDSTLDDFLTVQDVKGDRTKPFPVDGESQSTEIVNPNLQNSATPTYVDGEPQSTLYTEITPETTSEITHTRGVGEEKTFGFGIGSSTQLLVEPLSNHEQKSEELQIVSVDQSSAALTTVITKKSSTPDPYFGSRKRHFMKGSDKSSSLDPWMETERNPNPYFKQWLFNKRANDQKNVEERRRTFTASLSNASSEIRNDVDRAADLWQEFLEEMHQRFGIHQTRVAAGIPIAEAEHNEIAQIAPYALLVQRSTNLPMLSGQPTTAQKGSNLVQQSTNLPMLSDHPTTAQKDKYLVQQSTNLPMPDQPLPNQEIPSGAYGGADIYKEYKPEPLPSKEESLRGRELFIQQRVKKFTADNFPSMPKSKFIDTPTNEFAKYRNWLKCDSEPLRAEVIAWAESHSEDLDIDYDENGSIIDFTEVTF